jgi:hypothetical protein
MLKEEEEIIGYWRFEIGKRGGRGHRSTVSSHREKTKRPLLHRKGSFFISAFSFSAFQLLPPPSLPLSFGPIPPPISQFPISNVPSLLET